MRQVMKTILLVSGVMFGLLQSTSAYSPMGPTGNGGDRWQVPAIGYGIGGDVGSPKNLNEEYRRNTPVLYYSYDANFLGYFGSSGIAAVDSAMAMMNSLTNVSSYTPNLSEFPLQSRHINYQAQALGLYDLKSVTFTAMVEQMGLADPVRFAWTLHDRYHAGPAPCPVNMEYLVVQRNFDYISSPLNQLQYSPYVNNILYSYQIFEGCAGIPTALAEPYSADPLAYNYSPVATGLFDWGYYYTGLTRDDMAGLRYLMSSNNINWETAAPGSFLYTITTNRDVGWFGGDNTTSTNGGGTNALGFYYAGNDTNNNFWGYGDLAALYAFAKTNPPAVVTAAYPGLVVSSYTNYIIIASNAVYSYYYTNPPYGTIYGTAPILVVVTNYQQYPQVNYVYTFANVITNTPFNHFYTNTALIVNTTVAPPIGSIYGTPAVTNYTFTYTNYVTGDFFIFPQFYTNFCGLDIQYVGLIKVLATTNFLAGGTTNLLLTNAPASSNTTYLVTYFTNYQFVTHPVTCMQIADATGLYHGIENVKFVRADYDSLLGQYWQPVTNNYTMVFRTNSQDYVQYFQRVAVAPDFLFSARDMVNGPGAIPGVGSYARNLNFDQANILPGLAGPGTITTPTEITFNKAGPAYFNSSEDVMDGTPYFTQTPGGDVTNLFYITYFVWASYDGTTNTPVVYPNGTSLDNLVNEMLIKVSPTILADGYFSWPYSTTFTATGGAFTPPYTWSATGLPDGLGVSADGILSGNPTETGTFIFTLTLTDNVSRSVQWNFPITINE
jgi:hypothetical protein